MLVILCFIAKRVIVPHNESQRVKSVDIAVLALPGFAQPLSI